MNLRAAGEATLQASARHLSLLRLLLLAIGLGILSFGFGPRDAGAALAPLREYVAVLLLVVAAASALLAVAVRWVRASWHLGLQLLFDLCWSGVLVYCTGGVGSPAVVILFALTLAGIIAVPSALPFVMSSLSALVLTTSALLYVAGLAPLPENLHRVDAMRVLGSLAAQVVGLFLVDILGQLLVRRAVEQRAFTSELLDQLGEGVFAIDRAGWLVYANDEALRLLDLPDDVVGRRATEALAAPGLAPLRDLLDRDDLPVLQRHVAPGPRHLVLRLTALADRSGRPIGRTLLIADETRLLRLEESARRAEHLAALGEMAAGIAHEVRNPLTSLRGCAQEIAEMGGAGGRDAADLAAILVTEADRLARIVDDFLSFARLRPPRRDVIALDAVFAQLRGMHAHRTDGPAVALSFAVDEDCPPVSADPDQLRQILDNLIGNAFDAVRRVEAPRIAVTAAVAPAGALPVPAIELRIADNGPGIPPQLREQVFTPFFSTKSQGTGLGLALVQRIVREHEGAVRIEDAPGGGTTIVVTLPAHSQTRQFVRALGGR